MPVFHDTDLEYTRLPGRFSADPLAGAGVDTCSARVVRVSPGPRTPHRHPHSVEVIYVVQGSGRVWEDDRATAVSAGDVVLIDRGTPHATVSTSTSDLVLMCFFPHPDLWANIEELDGPVRD